MQTNYTQFRPDLKGVKVIKSYFFENTYHINAKRYDKRPKCCNKKMNIKDYRTVNWNVNTLVDNFYKDNC